MSEAEVNGLYAAFYGVPVGAITGDDQICQVAQKAFPGVTAVEVKKAVQFAAAESQRCQPCSGGCRTFAR